MSVCSTHAKSDGCQAQEAVIDPGTAVKLLVYSSLFARSTKNAVVDLALQQMEISE